MKPYFLIFLLFPILTFSQSKKELEDQLKETKSKLDSFQVLFYQQQSQYQQKILNLEATIEKIKFIIDNNILSLIIATTVGFAISNVMKSFFNTVTS